MNGINWLIKAGVTLAVFGLTGCDRDLLDTGRTGISDEEAAAYVTAFSALDPTLLDGPANVRGSCAVAANEEGGIVGMVADNGFRTVIWRGGPASPFGVDRMFVTDMNVMEQIIGMYPGGWWEPTFWSASTGQVNVWSPGDPENTELVAINNRGLVAATVPMRLTPETQFDPDLRVGIWNSATYQWRLLSWPERQPGVHGMDCRAAGINDRGWVGGSCLAPGGWRPFIWKSVEPTSIRTPDRWNSVRVLKMNQAGALLADAGRPVYWSGETGWIEIPIPERFTQVEAVALNDRGEVLLNLWRGWMNQPAVWSRARGIIVLGTGPLADRGAGFDLTNEGRIVGCIGPSYNYSWEFGGRAATWQLPR